MSRVEIVTRRRFHFRPSRLKPADEEYRSALLWTAATAMVVCILLILLRIYLFGLGKPFTLTSEYYERKPVGLKNFRLTKQELPAGWKHSLPLRASSPAAPTSARVRGLKDESGETTALLFEDVHRERLPALLNPLERVARWLPEGTFEVVFSRYEAAGSPGRTHMLAVRYPIRVRKYPPEIRNAASLIQDCNVVFLWTSPPGTWRSSHSTPLELALRKKAERYKKMSVKLEKLKVLGNAYLRFLMDVLMAVFLALTSIFITKYVILRGTLTE